MNKKRLAPKGHRRQYLRQDRTGFYELMKMRNQARKFEAWRSASIVSLIHAAKTTMPGTRSHKEIKHLLNEYARALGRIARLKLRLEIFVARLTSEKTTAEHNQHAKSVFERMALKAAA